MPDIKTKYASAERLYGDELANSVKKFKGNYEGIQILNFIPYPILILNKHRQIVHANKALIELFEFKHQEHVLGARPGEILNCKYSDYELGGCGTSQFCKACAAVDVILKSLAGNVSKSECQILTRNNEALDLMIDASPIDMDTTLYTILSINDISAEKRKSVLERTFFHDILNTASGLQGSIEMLKDADSLEREELIFWADEIMKQLIDEINSQKVLSAAEHNELELVVKKVESISLMKKIFHTCASLPMSRDKKIELDKDSQMAIFESDPTLVGRVLENMLKNAIEASGNEQLVEMGCRNDVEYVEFYVKNEDYIPEEIQLQIFKRSFTTKGAGRGVGTYSMKLLTDRYLRGDIFFTSDKEKGTVFYLRIPKVCKYK